MAKGAFSIFPPSSESTVRPSDRAFRPSLPHCSSTGAFFRAGGWLWHLSEIVQKFFTFSTILSCRHGLHDFCALRGFALMQALIERPCGMMGRHGYAGAPQQDHSGREIVYRNLQSGGQLDPCAQHFSPFGYKTFRPGSGAKPPVLHCNAVKAWRRVLSPSWRYGLELFGWPLALVLYAFQSKQMGHDLAALREAFRPSLPCC